MLVNPVNGTTANVSDTWGLKIHMHRYVFSIARCYQNRCPFNVLASGESKAEFCELHRL